MTQRTSWCEPKKLPKTIAHGRESGVIAQFFFPTDGSQFDTNDHAVMDQLVAGLRPLLRHERVDLAIIGHADHRGTARHNEALAQERAKRVSRELSRRLMDAPLFSHFVTLARGEHEAAQGTKDPKALAGDRRVDVMMSSDVNFSGFLRFERIPQQQKVVHRHYFTFAKEGGSYGPGATDTFAQGLEAIATLIKGGLNPRVRGDEYLKDRRYRYYDATYQVSHVDIHEVYNYTIATNAEIETWDTDIAYQWGKPPIPTVIVTYRKTITGDLPKGVAKDVPDQTHLLRRETADKDPLINPPPLPVDW